MLPEKVDTPFMGPANKAYYRECMDAGVRIYERGGEFIHSKTLVCDDYLSQIGTANIDNRSFNLNHEVNAYIYDAETALANKEIFFKDLAVSKEISPAEWYQSRKWYQKLLSRLLRLLAGVL
jgi:Phosphatidylserine/phosphatidylglycerophosphate/cardiolipin synthases and related enzymes